MAKKFATASGRLIDIENFTVDDVDLRDIAHNLAKEPRFNGATPINVSYSVGEHCINLARYFQYYDDDEWQRRALLHDASEAYLKDLNSPVKSILNDYKDLEKHVQTVIYERFNVFQHLADSKVFKLCDSCILIDEVETIMPEKLKMYKKETKLKKLGCHIIYNNHPSTVKQCFLTLAKRLGIE